MKRQPNIVPPFSMLTPFTSLMATTYNIILDCSYKIFVGTDQFLQYLFMGKKPLFTMFGEACGVYARCRVRRV